MIKYSDYLHLDTLLNAQHAESEKHGAPAHDELLFIITHQTFELWFKQVLFEVGSVIEELNRPYVEEWRVGTCLSRIQRVNTIMEHLVNQFGLIETMTPGDFMDFRAFLNPASGFQSAQWRILERTLGLPEVKRVLKNYAEALPPNEQEKLADSTKGPTLFSVIESWLEKMPFMETESYAFWEEYRKAVQAMLQNDRDEVIRLAEADNNDPADALRQIDLNESGFLSLFDSEQYNELLEKGSRKMSQRATISALFISTYRDYPLLQVPYRLLDAVIELDQRVSQWRFRHTMMVTRMIGMRIGTGGSSGHEYLMQTTLRQRIFDDLTSLSSFMIPRSATPHLPTEISSRLQFVNEFK
ncbi:MAG: tryptophan 2,3-dioxygenase [Ignavibacteria bacterium]|nr:tryptophan 2,3-dioxygenase [Ignavibacteria bacterium]